MPKLWKRYIKGEEGLKVFNVERELCKMAKTNNVVIPATLCHSRSFQAGIQEG